MRYRSESTGGNTYTNVVLIIVILAVAGAVLWPVLVRPREGHPYWSPCQSNMKELGIAINLYYGDYDGMLPSSILCGGSKTWSARDFTRFASIKGELPPPPNAREKTWAMVLYPHMKNKDIIWCNKDPDADFSTNANARISYYWKAAVDRAWYGEGKVRARKEGDFDFPADQVIFWEHNGWHWGDEKRGATEGVTLNMTFIDGHVQAKRVRFSGYAQDENPPGPLPRSMAGEPAFFNWSFGAAKPKGTVGTLWNTQMYGDNLP